ncbi:hypothetical protein LTR27_005237 [Elasticomyces elasticus]|nr:hypothetical protein LTR27_005237 [Elasticomyces elasticus]
MDVIHGNGVQNPPAAMPSPADIQARSTTIGDAMKTVRAAMGNSKVNKMDEAFKEYLELGLTVLAASGKTKPTAVRTLEAECAIKDVQMEQLRVDLVTVGDNLISSQTSCAERDKRIDEILLERGNAQADSSHFQRLAVERLQEIQELESAVTTADERVATLEASCSERNVVIQTLELDALDRTSAEDDAQQQITSLRSDMTAKDEELASKDGDLQAKSAELVKWKKRENRPSLIVAFVQAERTQIFTVRFEMTLMVLLTSYAKQTAQEIDTLFTKNGWPGSGGSLVSSEDEMLIPKQFSEYGEDDFRVF